MHSAVRFVRVINKLLYMILLDIHERSHDPETESEILVQYSVCNEHLFFAPKTFILST